MSQTIYEDYYKSLIILQYDDKPRATGEIALKSGKYYDGFKLLEDFYTQFDPDTAVGAQLDIIGRIVGLNRIVPFGTPIIYFGYDNAPNTGGYGEFESNEGAPYFEWDDPTGESYSLNDDEYRFLIKGKILKNWSSAYVVSDSRVSINDVANQLFDGQAYVTDNLDMTINIHVDSTFNQDRLRYIQILDIVPRGQGVGYNIVIEDIGNAFGYDDAPNTSGYGEFGSSEGGTYADFI